MIYTLLIGINIFIFVTEKNALEIHVSRAVENVLEKYYKGTDVSAAENQLKNDLMTGDGKNISMELIALDLEKGVISVIVQKDFSLITGKKKSLSVEKTAVVDRLIVSYPKVMVSFMVDNVLYKQYQVTKGEVCPIPKPPKGEFLGWTSANAENAGLIQEIGNVWEDKIYYAVMQ